MFPRRLIYLEFQITALLGRMRCIWPHTWFERSAGSDVTEQVFLAAARGQGFAD